MAAVGRSYILPEATLRLVREAATPRKRLLRGTEDEFWGVLERESVGSVEYEWSGYVLATLLSYLKEQGIDLMGADDETSTHLTQARHASTFILTPDQREQYLDRLDPSRFEGSLLRRYYEEFNETQADGVDAAMLDGIAFFRETLSRLDGLRALFISS